MQSVVDVFSCSYGPADNGWKMGDMGPMAKGAVRHGIQNVSTYLSSQYTQKLFIQNYMDF